MGVGRAVAVVVVVMGIAVIVRIVRIVIIMGMTVIVMIMVIVVSMILIVVMVIMIMVIMNIIVVVAIMVVMSSRRLSSVTMLVVMIMLITGGQGKGTSNTYDQQWAGEFKHDLHSLPLSNVFGSRIIRQADCS
ncbi:MAG: hypothetical protein VX527_09105 [Planctomycetota bacterium]|nr:hypothetical protein [Planctomycetota bacterium]